MARNLILAGGISHDFAASAPALAQVLSQAGIESAITEDVSEAVARLDSGALDMITIVLIRWTMAQPRFADRREAFGLSLTAAQRNSIAAFVNGGGAMLAMHAAVISFDDFPEWKEIVGARWVWDDSFHPPYGPVKATFNVSDHPIVSNLPDFELDDEVYSGLDMASGVVPLMTLAVPGEAPQPGLWARDVGSGRVVYNALGHDAASIRHPVHSRLIRRCAGWALRRSNETIMGI